MKTALDNFTTVLLRRNRLTPAQLEEALEGHRQTGMRLSEMLVRLGFVTVEEITEALAESYGLPFVNLVDVRIPTSIIEMVPESLARENVILPVACEQGTLVIAMCDPADHDLVRKLAFILNRDVVRVVAVRSQIIEAINRHYNQSETESVELLLQEFTDTRFELTPDSDEGRMTAGSDEEFELTLDDSGGLSPLESSQAKAGEERDIFETDFDVPGLEDESGSQAVALDEDADDSAATVQRRTKIVDAEDEAGETVSASCLASFESRAEPEVKKSAPRAQRQATVRYYHRMNPGKLFPLLVVLSKQKILEITQPGVSQNTSDRFKVELGILVEVEPILPGCTCYPPREQLRVGPGEPEEARFWVVPHVLGQVNQARVVVRQNGDLLAEVPLQIRVVKQTMTVVTAALALLLPLGAALLQHFKIDFRSQAESDFSFYREVAGLLLGALSPGTLALGLLLMTGGLYLWLRPRQRDLFWDVTLLGPQQRLALAREAFAGGNDPKGIRQVADLLTEKPGCQAAWLLQADREYARGHYREALALYGKALTLGTASAAVYARAALAAGQLGKNGRALAILKVAVAKLPPSEIKGAMWYNMGCFAARLGMFKDAVSYLGRAADAGYANLDKYRTDPDLQPLRSRREFQTLLACLDS